MNPLILVTRNGVIITPYTKGQSYIMEKSTSIYDEVYHKQIPTSGFIIENFNGSPAFISYKHRYDFLQLNFSDYTITQMRKTRAAKIRDRYHLNEDIILKPVQTDLANKVVAATKACPDWYIHLQTGLGKTILSVYLISIFKIKTVITCFSAEVLQQWVDAFTDHSTIDPLRICQIQSSSTLTKILSGDIDPDDYDIFICTPGLLTGWAERRDASELNEVFEILGIGLLIYDEAHRNKANICKLNALTNVKHSLYLSADYGQGDSNTEHQWFNIIKHSLLIEPSEDVQDELKNTKLIVVDYNSKPNSIEKDAIFNRYGYSAHLYMDYQLRRGIILDVVAYIINLILKINDGYRTLILTNKIEHVDAITTYLTEKYKGKLLVGAFHSEIEPDQKVFIKANADCIVSTYQSFGTGTDAKRIKYVIGLNQSNKIEDNQAAGRARPPEDGSPSIYFMIVDRGFVYCSKKLKTRLAYLKASKSKEDPYIYHYFQASDL